MKLTSQPRRTKSKERVFLLFGVAAATIGLFALQMNLYYERNYLGGVEALWRTNELFVFVQTNTTIEKEPRWNMLLSKYFGVWAENVRFTQEDVAVFHVQNNSLTEYRQQSFGLAGQFYPIDDIPHLVRGGYEVQGFKWSGNQFARITRDELDRIRPMLTPQEDFLAKAGWQKLDWEEIGNRNKEGDRAFPVGASDLKAELHIKVSASAYDQDGYVIANPHVELALAVDGARRTLASLDQTYRRISRVDFQKIVSRLGVTEN